MYHWSSKEADPIEWYRR